LENGTDSKQFSNDQSAEDGNRCEETQHGPPSISHNIGIINDRENNCNKQIRWNEEELKEDVWCFMYAKATTLKKL